MHEIDETLDSMTPAELAALEGELDKRAQDDFSARHYAYGQKLAHEALAEFEATGELPPILQLIKGADEAPAAEASDLDKALDACSPEELATIEKELDAASAEKSAADKEADHYYSAGVKLAKDFAKEARGAAGAGLLSTFGKWYSGVAKKNPIGTAVGTALVGAPVMRAAGQIVNGNR